MGTSKPAWLDYGKLKVAYAEVVGGAKDAYANNLYYSLNTNTFNNVAFGSISSDISPDANLKPLSVKKKEIGIEVQTLKRRVSLDLSFYEKNTYNEILNVDISAGSGFTQTKVNVGRLRNKGVEALLIVVPFRSEHFSWESTFNGSYNISKVIELTNGQQRFNVGNGEFFGTVLHEVGMPLASLHGYDYKRDAQGRILTVNGLPQQGALTADGTPNTTAVEAETFYTNYRSTAIATPFVYDASFVRWRTISLGYDFSKYFKKTFTKGVNFSLVVNNVLMINKYVDNLDPKTQVSASDNLQGIETHTLPTTRSYGFNLNVKL